MASTTGAPSLPMKSIYGSGAEPLFIDHENPAAPGGYAGRQLGHKSGGIASPRRDNSYRLSAQLPARVFSSRSPPLLFRPKHHPFAAEFYCDIHRVLYPPAIRGVLVLGLGDLHGDLLNLPSRSTTPETGIPFVLLGGNSPSKTTGLAAGPPAGPLGLSPENLPCAAFPWERLGDRRICLCHLTYRGGSRE